MSLAGSGRPAAGRAGRLDLLDLMTDLSVRDGLATGSAAVRADDEVAGRLLALLGAAPDDRAAARPGRAAARRLRPAAAPRAGGPGRRAPRAPGRAGGYRLPALVREYAAELAAVPPVDGPALTGWRGRSGRPPDVLRRLAAADDRHRHPAELVHVRVEAGGDVGVQPGAGLVEQPLADLLDRLARVAGPDPFGGRLQGRGQLILQRAAQLLLHGIQPARVERDMWLRHRRSLRRRPRYPTAVVGQTPAGTAATRTWYEKSSAGSSAYDSRRICRSSS